MAQRSFPCPQCGTTILVPDDYFRAAISCAVCRTTVDRRTGARLHVEAAAPANPQPAPYPAMQPPAYPPQSQYYAQGPAYPAPGAGPAYPYPHGAQPPAYPVPGAPWQAQAPAKRGKGWIIAVVVVVVVVGAFVVGMGAIIASKGAKDTEDWIEYENKAGRYRCKFPVKPREASNSVDNAELGRLRGHEAACANGGVTYEASYMDLGDGPPENYEMRYAAAAREIAKMCKGTVEKMEPLTVSGIPGNVVHIDMGVSRAARYFMARVGNRVYTVGAHSFRPSESSRAEFFIDNWSLIAAESNHTAEQDTVGDHPSARQKLGDHLELFAPHSICFRRGDGVSTSFRIEGGVAPYKVRLRQENIPQGLKASVGAREVNLAGVVGPRAKDGVVELQVASADGQDASRDIAIRVYPAESEIPVVTKGFDADLRVGQWFEGWVHVEVPNDLRAGEFKVVGSLPPGVRTRQNGPLLSFDGKPTGAGRWEFAVVWELTAQSESTYQHEITYRKTIELKLIVAKAQ